MSKNAQSSASTETEEQLIATAQEALSQCRWVVGECAAKWTARYARGRTDADFGALVGISGDQAYQRRRVWETFGSVREKYAALKWSHFYAALTWDDAADCLQWALDMEATVAEMRAWRRAQRGEDLSIDAPPEEAIRYLPEEPEAVQVPTDAEGDESRAPVRSGTSGNASMPGVARQANADGDDYAPFRSDAGSPPPVSGHAERPAGDALTGEQLAKRLAGTFERCAKMLTSEFCREFKRLPEPVRERFGKSVRELQSRLTHVK